MKTPIYFINAFTQAVFKGNSAAVVVTQQWLSDDKMQLIAKENRLSETAFIVQQTDGQYAIRWFSPLAEIDFCGHATLASAYVLFTFYHDDNTDDEITFTAKAVGDIKVHQKASRLFEMDFPQRAPELIKNVPAALFEGLSIKPKSVYKNQQAYFAVYDSDYDVQEVTATNHALVKLAPYDVVVTAPAQLMTECDFVSRYFWPANGGDEDPVTGSIHAGLVPFWAERLNKKQLLAYQASERGGYLDCRLTANRVLISGAVVPYLMGEIFI